MSLLLRFSIRYCFISLKLTNHTTDLKVLRFSFFKHVFHKQIVLNLFPSFAQICTLARSYFKRDLMLEKGFVNSTFMSHFSYFSSFLYQVQRYKRWLFEMSVSEFLTETKSLFQESNENQNPRKYLELSTIPPPLPPKKRCSCTFDDPQSFLNIMHRQVNCEDVGLKGYKFFTVTYGLIGTV